MTTDMQRMGLVREFALPAALCTLVAMVPHALLRAVMHTEPALFAEHPRALSLSYYAAHSWQFFMFIVACIMVVAAVLQQIQLRRLRRTGR